MSITSDLIRGHTDTIILAHLMFGDSYGYEINRSVQERTDGVFTFKEATLYSAFRRLEDAGCVHSYWGDSNSGARRRYYSITQLGIQTYNGLLNEWKEARTQIDKLVSVKEEQNNGIQN